jgi:hypothetical protein
MLWFVGMLWWCALQLWPVILWCMLLQLYAVVVVQLW